MHGGGVGAAEGGPGWLRAAAVDVKLIYPLDRLRKTYIIMIHVSFGIRLTNFSLPAENFVPLTLFCILTLQKYFQIPPLRPNSKKQSCLAIQEYQSRSPCKGRIPARPIGFAISQNGGRQLTGSLPNNVFGKTSTLYSLHVSFFFWVLNILFKI